MVRRLLALMATVTALIIVPAVAEPVEPTLDYDFFRTRVEPIFLAQRSGHARCVSCHTDYNTAFQLERLSPGAAGWSDEQSRHNFAAASRLVVPGKPDQSHLLLHPLAPEGGGEAFHSGGRQFADKHDRDWRTLAAWVKGARLTR